MHAQAHRANYLAKKSTKQNKKNVNAVFEPDFGQEELCGVDAPVEEAAAVVAQVEHEGAQGRGRAVGASGLGASGEEGLRRSLDILGGGRAEAPDAHYSDLNFVINILIFFFFKGGSEGYGF